MMLGLIKYSTKGTGIQGVGICVMMQYLDSNQGI
jgi:hypothetical protein